MSQRQELKAQRHPEPARPNNQIAKKLKKSGRAMILLRLA
jgi:hypothetical protein